MPQCPKTFEPSANPLTSGSGRINVLNSNSESLVGKLRRLNDRLYWMTGSKRPQWIMRRDAIYKRLFYRLYRKRVVNTEKVLAAFLKATRHAS